MKHFYIRPYWKDKWRANTTDEDTVPNPIWKCCVCGKSKNPEIYAIRHDEYHNEQVIEYNKSFTVQDYVCSRICGEIYIMQKMD